jgi:peptidoglycan/xylan/chitin deacetylase (PgdA/CDA1 family)
MQLDVLNECGYGAINCRTFLDWHAGRADGTKRVLITFDDGYADFATTAFPILRDHGFSAIVFVPTGKLGRREDWRGANAAPRELMDWATVAELARSGIEFGGHGVSHADLTRLAPGARRDEIGGSARDLQARLGVRPRAFAPPYGRSNADTRTDIARQFEVAFGTRFNSARRTSDRFDIPRIEMHYFRTRETWRAFLLGRHAYFRTRRALRAVRTAALAAGSLVD